MKIRTRAEKLAKRIIPMVDKNIDYEWQIANVIEYAFKDLLSSKITNPKSKL